MSDGTFTDQKVNVRVYGGLIIDIAEDKFAEAQKILAGVPGGAKKAIGSALARAGASGRTYAKKAVADEYYISQSAFMAHTRNINHYKSDGNGGLAVVFGFNGRVIPVIQFSARATDSGVIVNVKKSTGPGTLEHAFITKVFGHTGVYERVGKSRFPIKEIYGPATPQMMYSNEAVMDKIEEKVVNTFEKRADHEIMRLLNGWGV